MNLFPFWKNQRTQDEATRRDARYRKLASRQAAERGLSLEAFEQEIAKRTVPLAGARPARKDGPATSVWTTPHLDTREHLDVAAARTLPPERREHLNACSYCQEVQHLARSNPEAFGRRPAAAPLREEDEAPLPEPWRRPLHSDAVAAKASPPSQRGARRMQRVAAVGFALCLGLFVLIYPDVIAGPYRAAQQFARAPGEAEKLRQMVVQKEQENRRQTFEIVSVLVSTSGKTPSPWEWKLKTEEQGRPFLYCDDPEWQKKNAQLGTLKEISFKLNGQNTFVVGRLDKLDGQVGVLVDEVKLPEAANVGAAPGP